ncbi:MAG: transketolase [Candidatus Zixiibacteriota bacterium]|nr:MAG: transketolase [candidate division Zixibacteria bacterium]
MPMDLVDLQKTAKKIRADVLTMLSEAGSGHLGGSLGLADIFTALYFDVLNINPENPELENRDRLVLSIGHVAPVLYATLAQRGFFPVEELLSLRKIGSRLQGHATTLVPGVEVSTGSLGQGLSIATGMALAAKSDNLPWHVFSIHGDGELQEGQIWEAAMTAGKYKLNNLIAIVDRNKLQIDGKTETVMPLEPLANKWLSFGWQVIETNGNHMESVLTALKMATSSEEKPTLIIANTTMGKGVRSIENNPEWHGKSPSKEQLKSFLEEL